MMHLGPPRRGANSRGRAGRGRFLRWIFPIVTAASALCWPLVRAQAPQAPLLAFETVLKASTPSAQSGFGTAVAVSGNTAVVGAPSEFTAPEGEPGAGAVYVYVRNAAGWQPQIRLTASHPASTKEFGHAVALDAGTLVVGVPGDDSSASGVNGRAGAEPIFVSGAAYVYVRNGSNWVRQAYLKAPQPSENARFGHSVTVSGDWIAVGAPGDGGPQAIGAVYLFARSGGLWSQQARVLASHPKAQSEFGATVALDGTTLAVGAPGENSDFAGVQNTAARTPEQERTGASSSGAVYIFARGTGRWVQQAYVKASNGQPGDRFGAAVALAGELVVAGAPEEDGGGLSSSGAAYVFARSGGVWSQEGYLKASNPDSFDRFGAAVALAGGNVAVGAPGEASARPADGSNNGADLAGAAYVFRRSAALWGQSLYVKASVPGRSEEFGAALALSEGALLAAAPGDATGVPDSGAAHLFSVGPGGPEIAVELIEMNESRTPIGAIELRSGESRVDFGGASPSATVSPVRTFRVTNRGNADLTGVQAVLTTADVPSGFAVIASLNATIAPGASSDMNIQFGGLRIAGPRSAFLQVASNDADENPFVVRLTGYVPRTIEDRCDLSEECFLRYFVHCLFFNDAPENLRAHASPASGLALGHFYALETLLHQTPEGSRLAALYWQHTREMVQIARTNDLAAAAMRHLPEDFQPAVAALLSGNGRAAIITQEMVDQVNRTWSAFAPLASPALRLAGETERARFDGFQDFAGKNFAEWATLLGVRAPETPHLQAFDPVWQAGRFTVGANHVLGRAYTLWKRAGTAAAAWSLVIDAVQRDAADGVELTDPNAAPTQSYYRVQLE